MNRSNFIKIFATLIMVYLLSGCTLLDYFKKDESKPTDTMDKPDITATSSSAVLNSDEDIKKFANQDELKTFLKENSTANQSYYSGRGMEVDSVGFAEESVGLSSPKMTAMDTEAVYSSEGSDDYSETNVQVKGVDESDIIKTDGKYIYAVVKNDLYIVDAYPADRAEVLTKIAFESRPNNIYINDDKLVVFGQDTQIYKDDTYNRFKRRSSYTFFKVFDISDPENPEQVRDLDFEGSYYNSRMIGDYIYFIVNNYSYGVYDDEPVLPRVLEGGEEIATDCSGGAKCFMPDIYYFDLPYYSYNFTSVYSINVRDNNKAIQADEYLMSSGQNLYVSTDNMYIAYTKRMTDDELMMIAVDELIYPRLPVEDQNKIATIKSVEDYILTKYEKINKIEAVIEGYVNTLSEKEQAEMEDELKKEMIEIAKRYEDKIEYTVIHKIAVNEGELNYKTYGEVPGTVLNQFSMDQNGDYFRLVTTRNSDWLWWSDERQDSYNNLYVLNSEMETVGSVEKLAEGERIYSARFMGDRAYMVTFKQVDPLFAIDLSNPEKPEVLGALKIPGYSNYLHPYDENILIGFGMDTAESEWGGVRNKGLKLAMFDVSSVGDPKEIDTYLLGDAGSRSVALHEHKAFLFSKEKNLISVPVVIRESIGGSSWGELTFSGAAVFKVDETGFELKGKIDHSDGGKVSEEDYWRGYSYYDNNVLRSLYIDDVLYTFSNSYLMMNKLDDLSQVNKLKMKKNKGGEDDFEIIN